MGTHRSLDHPDPRLLHGVDLFSGLQDAQLDAIAQVTVHKDYARDEIIFLESDSSSQAMFVIVEGEVEIFVTGIDGREIILSVLGKGEFFGEMALLDEEPRSASTRTSKPSELLLIHRRDFLKQLDDFPGLAKSLLIEMSRRLRRADQQITSLALLSACGRISATLLSLLEEKGSRVRTRQGDMVLVLPNRPTHRRLAEMCGTTRETVTRVLNSLQEMGCISICGKDLFVLREGTLKSQTER